ncbi:MAG: ATP synthase F1 subunit delta [Thermoguttaceae bacterium]|nr:ATP synthase F1 subunit delta [Thermoguttaceae bacterium]
MPLNINSEQDAQYAAEFNADVTREQLAEVYAEALAGACEAKNLPLESLLEEYDSFIEDVFNKYPKFETVFSSIMVPTEEKLRMIRDIFKGISEVFNGFLNTLTRRGRLELLRDINRQCHLLNNRKKGRVPVLISTATPMDDQTSSNLVDQLRQLVGGEPEIRTIVDPDMVGGIIVRVGDTVYDASIATQLKKVRQQMIDRSAHEIQSRRDSFRNTEGN